MNSRQIRRWPGWTGLGTSTRCACSTKTALCSSGSTCPTTRRVYARWCVGWPGAGVGIERGAGPVVDALLAAGLSVFVISSRQVRALRLRYGTAGNKDDRFDAFVLADVLRTDAHRLQPLVPDTATTQALRALVRARKDLVKHRIALHNQLLAHLLAAYPAAVGLFAVLDSPISLRF